MFLQSFKKTQIILFTKAEVNKNIDILISFTDHVRFSFTDRQSNMEKKNSNKHLHHKPLLTQTHVYEQIGFQVFAYKYKKKYSSNKTLQEKQLIFSCFCAASFFKWWKEYVLHYWHLTNCFWLKLQFKHELTARLEVFSLISKPPCRSVRMFLLHYSTDAQNPPSTLLLIASSSSFYFQYGAPHRKLTKDVLVQTLISSVFTCEAGDKSLLVDRNFP